MEIFKELFPGCEISNEGRVRLRGRIRELSVCKRSGYKNIGIVTGLHRIVAFLFKDHPDRRSKDLMVDHIDRNPLNNRADNLRWVTRAENFANSDSQEMRDVCGDVDEITRISDAAKARAKRLAEAVAYRAELRLAKKELAATAKKAIEIKRAAAMAARAAAAPAIMPKNPPATPYLTTGGDKLRIIAAHAGEKFKLGSTSNARRATEMLEVAKAVRNGVTPVTTDDVLRRVANRMRALMLAYDIEAPVPTPPSIHDRVR